jgi:uncharacterized membrane-anchored protein
MSKPHSISGINFGDGPTSAVLTLAIVILVAYLAIARKDIQRPAATGPEPDITLGRRA